MAADYSRIHRLLRILTLIQGDHTWTASRLSLECGVTERTIYRDLKMLEGAGIPYFFDDDAGGYRIRRDFFMPPVELTLDESLAIVALGEHIGGREQIPLTRAAARAIEKVRCQLPPHVSDQLESVDPYVSIDLAASGPDSESIRDVYDAVRVAIASRRALSCEYMSVERTLNETFDSEPFRFKPYALFFNQRSWYTIGYHAGRDDVRCLKLNRFTAVKVTEEPYAIPDDFSLKEYLGNAWRMIRGERRYDVEILFDRDFAETVGDTHWHKTQEIEDLDDGSILYRCTVDGLDEIIWWILGMGPHCKVLKPDVLADRVLALADGIAARYRDSEGDGSGQVQTTPSASATRPRITGSG